MGIEGFLATDEARAARALIDQAALILAATDGSVPASFVAALFARTAPEDLRAYGPHELAALAREAYTHLSTRKPGVPDIRVFAPEKAGDADRLPTVTVIEIVNDDMPFLLDSVMDELTAQGLTVRLVAHPVLVVERDGTGRLLGAPAAPEGGARGARESLIHVHVDRLPSEDRAAAIVARLADVLAEVRLAVDDWKPMQQRVRAALAELAASPPPLPAEEITEANAFIEWLLAGQFTFLGCRDYRIEDKADGGATITPLDDTGLGILRDPSLRLFHRFGAPMTTGPRLAAFLHEPVLLIVSKSNVLARVHRRVWMDVVSLKRFDAEGRLVGELRIAGLFTSVAYTSPSSTIPYLRRKAARVLARAGFDPAGHSGKALVNVLDSYPRDDLFQVEDDELYHAALAILQLEERPRLRVLARRERFDRFVSVLCFIPRDRYDSTVRERIGAYLATAFGGRIAEFRPLFLDGPLTRVHFIVERVREEAPNPDHAELEAAIGAIVRTWADGFAEALGLVYPAERANGLRARYAGAFPAGYRDAYAPQEALADLRLIEKLDEASPLAAQFHAAGGGEGPNRTRVALKVLSFGRPRPLSERVPLIEAMGFTVVDERTFTVEPAGIDGIYVHDMVLVRRGGGAIALDQLESRLHAGLTAVFAGEAESDGFNALILNAGLPWREVALIRTLARYLRQVGTPYSQDYLWATLNAHPAITADLVALFAARFNPAENDRAAREAEVKARIETALGDVASLDEDRILRAFANLIEAGVRTSFYQRDEQGRARSTIAVKFASGKIDGLPLPRPLFEIFVHSPRVEGVHLRFGRVARGGLRWSDRPQDFRTEVLGLVKAQQVKNAVIVPVGAKGGFVPKQLPPGPREAIQEEGIAAYKLFVGSLLDLTDNIEGGDIVHPGLTVRHDEDDPYLVVAADKGTATFSDIANGLSVTRGFWLGDAFASGGSVGYDHKAMGITARGAWEAVRRHFREMDVDIRTTPFTVTGVGDMSGDVFGNGMMLENTIRLVAAFDHRDIFLDPNPDPTVSLAERQRLFALPRSSWQDYDKSLISQGGGVFPRASKSVPLSPEIRAALGFDRANASPAELMSAILKAPVDLLWFGGIGTYIRSSQETDAQAGDKANDAVRITGADVRAKVIGEGANLGVTQRGRIEAARRGVRLNTDAIDNSAGVNTSDVEVNIKIALVPEVNDGRLDAPARAAFLAGMTDEVASLVLRNNYLQTLALSLAQRHGTDEIGFHQRLMQQLEARGLLDRTVEFLPADSELAERRSRGEALTRPELAVLLAYAKLTLHADLLETGVPDDPYLADELSEYFPAALRETFPDGIEHHRLRRDIIGTRLSNAIINHGGPAFVARLADGTGADVASIAKAFAATYDSFRLGALGAQIDALDAKVPGAVQLELYAAVETLLRQRTIWFLRNVDLRSGLGDLVAHYSAAVEPVEEVMRTVVRELIPEETLAAFDAQVAAWTATGVPEDLAKHIGRLGGLESATDIVMIADRTNASIPDAAETFFAVGLHFRLDRLFGQAAKIPAPDYYDRLALERALASFEIAVRRLTSEVLTHHGAGAAGVAKWAESRGTAVERARSAMHEIAGSGLTVSKLSVAASLLGDLVTG